MEFEHTNSNNKISKTIKVKFGTFSMKKCENWTQLQIQCIIFSKRCYACLQNKDAP